MSSQKAAPDWERRQLPELLVLFPAPPLAEFQLEALAAQARQLEPARMEPVLPGNALEEAVLVASPLDQVVLPFPS
jgi:hypothetical protein